MVRSTWGVVATAVALVAALAGPPAAAQAPDSTAAPAVSDPEAPAVDTLSADPLLVRAEAAAVADDPRTPRGALFRSLAVPGWGQVYNGQWGKAPIALGAVAGMATLVALTHVDYLEWREAYLFAACRAESPVAPCEPDRPDVNPFAEFEPTWQALGEPSIRLAESNRDTLRRNRDFSILIGLLVYGLQALDAYVSGHLLDFDVGEDLSLQALPTPQAVRLSLRWAL